MSTEQPATPAEVAAQLARVRDGLTEQRESDPAGTDYDRGQVDGAVTGLSLALRMLARLPGVADLTGEEYQDAATGTAELDDHDGARILPFSHP